MKKKRIVFRVDLDSYKEFKKILKQIRFKKKRKIRRDEIFRAFIKYLKEALEFI